MAGNRWRYELYAFDFAIGAILFALIAAYTFGNFGADLGFSEQLMLSSKTNQAWGFVAGGLFGLGNILLLAAIALLGLSLAYLIATGSALLALGALEFAAYRGLFIAVAMGAAFLAIVFEAIAAHHAEEALPAASLPVVVRVHKSASGRSTAGRAPQVKVALRNSNKGLIVAILAGLLLGGSIYPFNTSLYGQFGLGTFAGVLLFCTGTLAVTLFVAFLLMNVPIHGGPTSLKTYFRGSIGRHILGLAGGALCAGGILLITMVVSLKEDIKPDGLWIWVAALAACLLPVLIGLAKWREIGQAPGAASSLLVGAFLVVVAIGVFALAMDKTPPFPAAHRLVLPQSQFPS